jgi:putative hydrolase of the HAD superfamily
MKDKIIIFDLDDTLILEEALAKKAFLKTCSLAEKKYKIDRYSLYETVKAKAKVLWHGYETEDYAMKIGISSWEALWGDFSGDDENLKIIRSFIDEYRLNSWYSALLEYNVDDIEFSKKLACKFISARAKLNEFFPESLSVLKKLFKTYRLGLLTNGAPGIQWAKINKSGIKKYFNHIIISGEVGIGKPNIEIFNEVLNKFKAIKDNIIYIGNSPRSDIDGAKNAGFYTVWINRDGKQYEGKHKPDKTIKNLKEIFKIIP